MSITVLVYYVPYQNSSILFRYSSSPIVNKTMKSVIKNNLSMTRKFRIFPAFVSSTKGIRAITCKLSNIVLGGYQALLLKFRYSEKSAKV